MADFSIISDVSNAILKLLREQICPELIQSPEAIQMISPSDKNADYQLGLYLYDIQELREYKQLDLIRLEKGIGKYPPKPLNLYYALFINSKAQMMSDAENDQRILGRAMQVLMDNSILNDNTGEWEEENPSITSLPLSFEDKTKIWSVLSLPYQLAVYFSVAPVMLSSRRMHRFTRVLSTEIRTGQSV